MTSASHALVWLTGLAALGSVGCTEYLPPVETPERIAPSSMETPPLQAGLQRLVLDVVDGPTDVFSVTRYRDRFFNRRGQARSRTLVERELLCRTPCAVDLAESRYILGFPTHGAEGRLERVEINLGSRSLVHRRALGTFRGAGPGLPIGVVATVAGALAFVVGAVLVPVGLIGDDTGSAIGGGVAAGTALLPLTLGIVSIATNPHVERPGAGVTFAIP